MFGFMASYMDDLKFMRDLQRREGEQSAGQKQRLFKNQRQKAKAHNKGRNKR